ncbi:MAG TPA: hypothetical protein PKL31_10505 [Fulvivirga sp.]|nr:hypothetical protein [Fulvivirga sp.]
MEYVFKNSPKDKLRKIVLTDDGFNLIMDGATYPYKYSSVNQVWLNSPGGFCSPGEYSCTLNIVDQKPLYISSKNYSDSKKLIDQFNHYNSFIRVLHLHLKNNKAAQFKFGTTPFKYLTRIMVIIGILTACVLSIMLLEANPLVFIVPSGLAIFVSVCGMKFCINRFPKVYNPENIPLTLLPA